MWFAQKFLFCMKATMKAHSHLLLILTPPSTRFGCCLLASAKEVVRGRPLIAVLYWIRAQGGYGIPIQDTGVRTLLFIPWRCTQHTHTHTHTKTFSRLCTRCPTTEHDSLEFCTCQETLCTRHDYNGTAMTRVQLRNIERLKSILKMADQFLTFPPHY